MRSAREHVHGLDFFGLVAEFVEDGDVAGEAGGVAGDVDDAVWFHAGKGLQHRRRTAGTRRVDDYDVSPYALLIKPRHDLGRIADDEFGVAHVVVPGIFLRIEDSWFDDFDADDASGLLGEEQGYRSRAAVGVDDRLLTGQVGKFQGLVVEHFRLGGVDLEEGARRDMEVQAADAILDGGTAPEEFRVAPHDDVIVIGLDILMDTDDLRQFGAQHLDEFFFPRHSLRGRYDDDHNVALFAYAANDVAQDACMLVLIVNGDVEFRDDFTHGIDHFVVAVFLDMAVSGIDDFVATLGEAADDGLALLPADGELHLVAVVPRRCRADCLLHEKIRLFADARDSVDDLLAFGLELGHIVKVLQLAAAAFVIDAADRLDAVGALGEDFFHLALGIGLFDLVNDSDDLLPGQSIRHKDRKVLIAAYAFAARTERLDFNLV